MNKIKTIIGVIAVPIFCLLLSFFVLITDNQFTYLLLSETSVDESLPATEQLFSYFLGVGETPSVFDSDEQSHLSDVRFLIWMAFIVFVLCAIIVWKTISLGIAKKGLLLLAVMLVFSSIVPFDALFDIFHRAFFPQGNWMFPSDSTLINFYPFEFFMKYAQWIALNSLVCSGMLVYLEQVTKSSHNKKI